MASLNSSLDSEIVLLVRIGTLNKNPTYVRGNGKMSVFKSHLQVELDLKQAL